MKHLIILLFCPFILSSQTYDVDTTFTENGFVLRYIDVSDSTKISRQLERIDLDVFRINRELDRIRDEIDNLQAIRQRLNRRKNRLLALSTSGLKE